ncbi:Hypothetical Protein FCC1311_084642, partial [Hondaea fermentalgiana]
NAKVSWESGAQVCEELFSRSQDFVLKMSLLNPTQHPNDPFREGGATEGPPLRPGGAGDAAALDMSAWESAGTACQPLAETDGNTLPWLMASAGSLDDYMALKTQAGVLEASCVSGSDVVAPSNSLITISSTSVANAELSFISLMIESLSETDV